MKGEVRLSSILVSEQEGLRLYRSFDEVPEAVKRRLQRALEGERNTTLVIADRRGREQLAGTVEQPVGVAKVLRWKGMAEMAAAGAVIFLLWVWATLR